MVIEFKVLLSSEDESSPLVALVAAYKEETYNLFQLAFKFLSKL